MPVVTRSQAKLQSNVEDNTAKPVLIQDEPEPYVEYYPLSQDDINKETENRKLCNKIIVMNIENAIDSIYSNQVLIELRNDIINEPNNKINRKYYNYVVNTNRKAIFDNIRNITEYYYLINYYFSDFKFSEDTTIELYKDIKKMYEVVRLLWNSTASKEENNVIYSLFYECQNSEKIIVNHMPSIYQRFLVAETVNCGMNIDTANRVLNELKVAIEA
jgi:hypothetical protein